MDEKYPEKVALYEQGLKDLKAKKINKHDDTTFVDGNLMWLDNDEVLSKTYNIIEAKRYCKTLRVVKRSGWRLPTYHELLSLVDYKKYNPAIVNGIEFIDSKKFWTISTDVSNNKSHWFVDFVDGTTSFEDRWNKNYVRCVREISKKRGDY